MVDRRMFHRRHRRLVARSGATLAVLGLAAAATVTVVEEPVAAAGRPPNIILVTTDDMTLTDLRWMPQTRKLVRGHGAEVQQFISNHPICCPARAEILTGQHAQNNGVHHNNGELGGYAALKHKGEHVGAWLRKAGYRTAFVGKHLNLWELTRHNQPGWTRFNPILRGIYHPFEITMWRHGRPKTFSGTHTSDLVGAFTKRYIRSFSRAGDPFFIWTSQVAPHGMNVNGVWGPPRPAVRHRTLYPDAMPPTLADPAYDEQDVSDKPQYVQDSVTMAREDVISLHRARIRSLRSVDDQVKGIVDTLRDVGQLRNTFLFFTSDNGYMLGEHRLSEKNVPYEQAVRIPLVVRGPGVPAGSTRDELFSLVDLAPTFLHIAQAAQPSTVLDGRSMLPTLRHGQPGYDHHLIQAGATDRPWWWRGVRSRQFTYVRYDDGFEELYDLQADPHQLVNVADDVGYADTLVRYQARLASLGGCSGQACWSGDVLTPPEPSATP